MQFDIKVIPRNAMVCFFVYISEVIIVTTNMRRNEISALANC